MPSLIAPERVVPLLVLAAGVVLVCTAGRRLPPARSAVAARSLAILAIGAECSWWGYAVWNGNWVPKYNLPLHLCEASAFVIAIALWWRPALMVEIGYYWGVGGVTLGLITPDMPGRFPDYVYFQYCIEHVILVLSALFMVVGLQLRPRTGSVMRVFSITALYASFVGIIDYATGANYMFLRHIPSTGTLLDDLGPWPWYIVLCALIALAIFTLLYLPFSDWRHRADNRLSTLKQA